MYKIHLGRISNRYLPKDDLWTKKKLQNGSLILYYQENINQNNNDSHKYAYNLDNKK